MPNGDIVAIPERGTMTGNRGILHGPERQLSNRRWSHKAWICCVLDWQGRRREVMTGRNWTELFFLDEAVALAAGHRPCGYCRRDDYRSFKEIWARSIGGAASAPEIDKLLHVARIDTKSKEKKTFRSKISDLPQGCFVSVGDHDYLVCNDGIQRFTPNGYGPIQECPSELVSVLTPKPIVTILRSGYRPELHKSALPTST